MYIQPTQKRYFYTLDGIRGVAAILVVLSHIEPFFGTIKFQENHLAVDIFFVLSGVVIANAYEARLYSTLSFKQFCLIRWARLYPLYIFGSAVSVLAIFLGVSKMGNPLIFLIAIFMIPKISGDTQVLYPLNGPAWSLFFELIANVIYARFFRLLTVRLLIFIMFISAIYLAFFLLNFPGRTMDAGWNIKTIPVGLFRVGYSFFAGVLLYRLFSSKILDPTLVNDRYSTLALGGVLALIAAFLLSKPTPVIQPYFELFAIVAVFPFLIYLGMRIQPKGPAERICKFMGTISYAIYAIHLPIADLIKGFFRIKLGSSVESCAPQIGFIFLVLLIGFCWFIDIIYDFPVRKFLLKRSKMMYSP